MTKYFLSVLVLLALAPFLLLVSPSFAAPLASNCAGTSVGKTPLNDLGTGTYNSYEGGLYPNGLNVPPGAYLQIGMTHTQNIRPRDSGGALNSNGKIVLLSIGMSNATQEFSMFKSLADPDPMKNSRLVIVDGAVSGQDAEIIRNPNAPYWNTVAQRITSAGVYTNQVQAAWLKEAIAGITDTFPSDATRLQNDFAAIVGILQSRYPNLQNIYLASRTYAGYASSSLNPEPYAYQSGFAVKWLIESQITGSIPITAPWLAWGPYLWADGTTPRSDGLIWLCSDFQSDGTHPSSAGQTKVANMLLTFFKSDQTTRPWFLNNLLFLPVVTK